MATTTTSLAAGFLPKFWDRKIGENLRPRLYLYDFGDKRTIPMGTGKTIIIPRILKRTAASGVVYAATEGTAPTNLCSLSSQLISGTLQQFVGGYRHSDVIAMVGLSDVVSLAVKEIGYDMARQMDVFNWNQISGTGVNVYGSNLTGATSGSVGTTKVIQPRDVMKAVVTLDAYDNPRFPGTNSYAGYMHPKIKFDIWAQSSSNPPTMGWIDMVKYVDAGAERIFNGEVGKFFGVKFVESTRQRISYNGVSAGGVGKLRMSAKASGALTQIFAPESYYVTALEGLGAPQTFVKPLGSAGAADPANQFGTVAAKVFYTLIPVTFTSAANEARIVRIFSGRSIA